MASALTMPTESTVRVLYMTTRNIARYAARHVEYDNLEHFLISPIKPGLNTIGYEGRVIDALIERTENTDTLIVSFSPAVTSEKVTRPYFVGAGIFRTLNAHKLYLSDPSLELDDELKLGWFAGSGEQRNLQHDLASIIANVIAELKAKHVILVGTSGGGFASLYYSLSIPGSLAFVVNPQTDLLKYHKQHVSKYAKYAWGMGFDKAVEVLPKRAVTSVVDQYSRGPGHAVLWLQSITDLHHIEHHMRPLLESVKAPTDIRVLLGEGWGPGHHPAPRELQVDLLEAAVAAAGKWENLWELFPAFERPAQTLARVTAPAAH